MLRLAVLAVGIVLLVIGIVLASYGVIPALWCLIMGGLLTVGVVLERVFYKPLEPWPPGAGWVRTDERFVDPDSGKMVDVFYHQASGERRYVAQESPGSAKPSS